MPGDGQQLDDTGFGVDLFHHMGHRGEQVLLVPVYDAVDAVGHPGEHLGQHAVLLAGLPVHGFEADDVLEEKLPFGQGDVVAVQVQHPAPEGVPLLYGVHPLEFYQQAALVHPGGEEPGVGFPLVEVQALQLFDKFRGVRPALHHQVPPDPVGAHDFACL